MERAGLRRTAGALRSQRPRRSGDRDAGQESHQRDVRRPEAGRAVRHIDGQAAVAAFSRRWRAARQPVRDLRSRHCRRGGAALRGVRRGPPRCKYGGERRASRLRLVARSPSSHAANIFWFCAFSGGCRQDNFPPLFRGSASRRAKRSNTKTSRTLLANPTTLSFPRLVSLSCARSAARPRTRCCGSEASEPVPFPGADLTFSSLCGAIFPATPFCQPLAPRSPRPKRLGSKFR